MNRVLFLLGLGAGFVLGARAGRERYETIRRATRSAAASEPVQRGLAEVQHAVDTATPRVRRAARQAGDEAGQLAQIAVGRTGDGAKALAAAVTGLADRATRGSEDLQKQMTLTAEDLRRRSEELRTRSEEQLEELRRRSEEQLEELRHLGEEQLDQVRRRVDEQRERSREQAGESIVRLGSAREEALDVWDDDEDDERRADDRDDDGR